MNFQNLLTQLSGVYATLIAAQGRSIRHWAFLAISIAASL